MKNFDQLKKALVINIIFFYTEILFAANSITSGLKNLHTEVLNIAIGISAIAFVIAAIAHFKNRQEGGDKFMGAFQGTVLAVVSLSITKMIVSIFS